ncbi:hypothetical protein [Wohlfahrtiimonas larvae]|uniref:DUF983 domain-containing protein n=1 Tax=Wohlfahrtiimonas larvae TaxID=1157986 RepID=A0ABP9MN10_9GAMM|nr:hypothetical protein [Wohlfahrtiimonas larvae]
MVGTKIINQFGGQYSERDINNIAHNYPLCTYCCQRFQLDDAILPYCRPCTDDFREEMYQEEYAKIHPTIDFWQKVILYPAIASVIGFLGLLMYLKIDNIFVQFGVSTLFLAVMGGIGYYPLKIFKAFKYKSEQRICEKVVREFPFNQAELDQLNIKE